MEQAEVDIGRLRQQYRDFSYAKQDEIEEQRQARHYYHGDQWTSSQLAELKKRNQPPVTRNKVGRKIDGVVGILESLRNDPKAFPRTPQHEEGAEIATAVMRYVLDEVNWETMSSQAGRNAAIGGIGGVELVLSQGDRGDPDLDMEVVPADSFFYDPRSFRQDFSDALYLGVGKWVDLDVAQEQFPDKAEELTALLSQHDENENWQLQDKEKVWVNVSEKRIFLVDHWYFKKGKWHWCIYAASVKLDGGESPFIDEDGKTFPKYVMFSAYVDHEGDRYGMIRNMKSIQDEINSRYSKGLHLLHTRRFFYEASAIKDVNKAKREMVRPDGAVELNPGALSNGTFQTDDAIKNADLQGQIAFLEKAETDIENFGPNPAVIGEGIENKSGRAISLLQQAGLRDLGPFTNAYRDWKIRIYRAVWNTVQRFWTSERWIRVTDDEDIAQFIQLNGLSLDEYGMPTLVNALGSLDVDIIIDEGPDTLNMVQDAYDTLLALSQKGAMVPPQVLIELSQLPSDLKKRVLEMMEQAQQPPPGAQEAMQLEMMQKQADLEKTGAETQKVISETEENYAQIDQVGANALKALRDAHEPYQQRELAQIGS